MKISIVGTGYVGLVTGVCLAEVGHNVICVDVDENKINNMKKGVCPIYEDGLENLMIKNYKRNRIDYTNDYKKAYKNSDIIMIAVGTPERSDGSANLDYVKIVSKQIAEIIEKDTLIVIKSTVPIGTNDEIELLMKKNLKKSLRLEIASNPEFLAQGTAIRDTLKASRIVIGTESKWAEELLRKVYLPFGQPIISTDRKSAEMIKYASNDFLALKISFINDIANFCEIVGANIEDVTKGMSYDERIGDKFLKAGIGYGGSCFPKDTKALHWLACDRGYELKTIKAAIEVNENQKLKLMRKARTLIDDFEGKKIAILGAAFKPGTDDVREAPSIPNIRYLIERNAKVYVYDPIARKNVEKIFGQQINYCETIEEAIIASEACFIMTEWNEIKEFNIIKFKELMKNCLIFDGRNCYDYNLFESNQYYSIGRGNI